MAPRVLGGPPATPPVEKVTRLDQDKITWADRLDLSEQAGVDIFTLWDEDDETSSLQRKEIAVQWLLARKNGSPLTFAEFCDQPIVDTELIKPDPEPSPAPKARARKRAGSA